MLQAGMSDNPLISVIVPVYETEPYLEKCLRSLAEQTLSDFEVLCVNDATPDQAGDIVDAFAARDPRFIHIKHDQNLGLGGARNTGLRQARATYVASVDSDDWAMPHMLEQAYTATETGLHDIVCFGFRRVDCAGQETSKLAYKPRVKPIDDRSDIFRTVNPAFWNKLWRRSLFVDHNIFFPNHVYGQDLATTPRILTRARSIRFIEDILYNYLQRADSATHRFDDKHFVDYIKVFDVIYDFLQSEGLWERYRDSFLLDVVAEGLRFHGENLLASNLSELEKDAHLRHLLILRDGYIRSNHILNSLDRSQMVHRLAVSKSLLSYEVPVSASEPMKPETLESLSKSVRSKTPVSAHLAGAYSKLAKFVCRMRNK